MKVLETARLSLRELNAEDAAFILELVNEPAWLRFIGDRGLVDEEKHHLDPQLLAIIDFSQRTGDAYGVHFCYLSAKLAGI